FVMHEKEYLVAIFSRDGILRAETLRFSDEVRTPDDVGLKAEAQPDSRRVAAFVRAMDKLKEARLKPELLENEYAAQVRKLLARRRKHGGPKLKISRPESTAEMLDLTEILKRALASQRAGKKRANPSKRSTRSPTRAGRKRRKRPA